MYRIFLVALTLIVSCAHEAFGQMREYKLNVKDFTELKVNNSVNVDYCCSADSAGLAFFTCSPSVVDHLIFSNNKGSLMVQVDDEYDKTLPLPTIKVYSTFLEKVENGADSTVRVLTNERVRTFSAKLIGNGTIIVNHIDASSANLTLLTGHGLISAVAGAVVNETIKNVGKGTIQAGGLKARQVKASIYGTGSIDCCASEQLSVYGMGSGCVYYSGNPAKVANRSAGVKAHAVN